MKTTLLPFNLSIAPLPFIRNWMFLNSFVLLLSQSGTHAQEIDLSFNSDGLILNGTLTTPDGIGPFPTILFVHGSGPNDRDQTFPVGNDGNTQCLYPGLVGSTIRSFADMASSFREKGYATFRYDKRTFSHPNLNLAELTTSDFIIDAHAALDHLKTRAEVDTNCLIVLGHSQGANFVPIVADQRNDVSAIIGMGTVATSIDSVLAYQFQELFFRCAFDTAQGNSYYNQTISDFSVIRSGQWPLNTPYLGAYAPFWLDWIGMTENSTATFAQNATPTAFLHVMEDFNVPVENADRLETSLGPSDILVRLPGLNHHFTPSNDPGVDASVVDTLVYWLDGLKTTGIRNSLHPLTQPPTVGYTSEGVQIGFPPSFTGYVSVFDLSGQQLWSQAVTRTMSILNGQLNPGMYIVRYAENELGAIKILIR